MKALMSMALMSMAMFAGAQQETEIEGRRAYVFGNLGRPPRAALGYGQAVFVTPATLEAMSAEANSVVELRHPGHTTEARIFPILDPQRQDDSLYMAKRVRDALGVDTGLYRVELIPLGLGGGMLGSPETELPALGEPNTWVFARVGMPPRETLSLGDAAFVREDVLQNMGVPAGTPVTITVGAQSIEVPLHPLPAQDRLETSLYLRSTLRERLGLEDGPHQVLVQGDGIGSGSTASAGSEEAAITDEDNEE